MPRGKRQYLPSHLTKGEKADPRVRAKLSRCIRAVEKKSCPPSAKKGSKYVYSLCKYNPVAVCRRSILKKQ